jgi:hypothetical protein
MYSERLAYRRIREILESAQAGVARTVNSTQAVANWLIGPEMVEEEQKGERRGGIREAVDRRIVRKTDR